MSCENEFFIHEEQLARETWLKDIIDGKYPNINYLIYRGGSDKNYLEGDVYHIHCEDDIKNTFKKTWCALNYVQKEIFDKLDDDEYYPYVFRTNTSTYVNVPLLEAFVNSLNIEEEYQNLWCSELYSLSEGYCPYPLMLFGRGNGLLMSSWVVSRIIYEGRNMLYLQYSDDISIGNILNSKNLEYDKYWYINYIKSFKHGWWKCISGNAYNNHTLCTYYNSNSDYEYLKQFITIQIKRYHEREREESNYYELHELMKNKKDNNILASVKDQYQYSKNPNIFIGSILGYITLEQWKMVDKKHLFDIQIHNKSSDDENRNKQLNMILL